MSTHTGTADILTVSGKFFDYLNPESSEFSITDIAYALSNLCRFSGQIESFYSVAQHSVLVSRLVPAWMARHGLLHDATEAFIVDVPGPLKRLMREMGQGSDPYSYIEARVERAVFERFGLPYPMPFMVKAMDKVARIIESRDLQPEHEHYDDWSVLQRVPLSSEKINPWPPETARLVFLERYHELSERGRW
ncbi:MAG: metal-dependent phosphohydrolase [Chloroflexi bacterium]|nr:metal-dependent phosphohydrolase [Chloroflexota bacterium]